MAEPVHPSLKRFIWDIQSVVELAESEREILVIGRDLMARLVAADDWLPAAFAVPEEAGCRHYLLYGDGQERFSVVAAVYSPGQAAAICRNDVWEITGVLRGAVSREHFSWRPGRAPHSAGRVERLSPGAVSVVSAKDAGAAQSGNALADAVSISIHVHGGEAGQIARHAIDPDGEARAFVSAYANPEDSPAYDIWSIQTKIDD